jgi:hypothetical protein
MVMGRQEATGTADVAALLRTVADGVERGVVDFDGSHFPVSDDLRAVTEAVGVHGEAPAMLSIRLALPHGELRVARELERELAHPGD